MYVCVCVSSRWPCRATRLLVETANLNTSHRHGELSADGRSFMHTGYLWCQRRNSPSAASVTFVTISSPKNIAAKRIEQHGPPLSTPSCYHTPWCPLCWLSDRTTITTSGAMVPCRPSALTAIVMAMAPSSHSPQGYRCEPSQLTLLTDLASETGP